MQYDKNNQNNVLVIRKRKSNGSIMLLALVFGAIFFTVFSGLSGYVIAQNNLETYRSAQSDAAAIAEAGLEYYRWHLAHFPSDLQNGTGHAGPYTIAYNDKQTGAEIGTYTLDITSNQSCGKTISINIKSTGRPVDNSSVSQTLVARYARPTVAKYDFISNAGVWIGQSDIVHGPYHSNSGIRMDGFSNAPMTSSLATWTCTWAYNCNPSRTEPGVFGSGSDQSLWKYPTPQVDFGAIAANFASLKTIAESPEGIYLPRYSSGSSGGAAYHKGYHLVFNSNDTVTIYKVIPRKLRDVYLLDKGVFGDDYALINKETLYKTLPISTSCGLIFVEDNTWVSGVIPTKVTLIVANVSDQKVTPDAFLSGNITYVSNDGSDGLTLISAHSVLITPNSPQDMTLDGVYIAQSGAFGRNYYLATSGYRKYEPRGTLTTVGTVVSSLQSAATYEDGYGKIIAGYKSTVDYPDQQLAADPPPFTPTLSPDYQFVSWRQN